MLAWLASEISFYLEIGWFSVGIVSKRILGTCMWCGCPYPSRTALIPIHVGVTLLSQIQGLARKLIIPWENNKKKIKLLKSQPSTRWFYFLRLLDRCVCISYSINKIYRRQTTNYKMVNNLIIFNFHVRTRRSGLFITYAFSFLICPNMSQHYILVWSNQILILEMKMEGCNN